MDPELLEPLVVGTATVVAALLGLPRFLRDQRSSVLIDLQIYNALPDESSQKKRVLDRIDAQLESLDASRDARRDPTGSALALFLIGSSVIMGLGVIGTGGWWLALLPVIVFLALIGVAGAAQSFPKRVRDAKGRPLQRRRRQAPESPPE
ncbi:hypothetical protein [Arthrobacter sp. MDT1-65]